MRELADISEAPGGGYVGVCMPAAPGRAFGGQACVQAMAAAARVAAAAEPIAVHATFVRPARSEEPIEYRPVVLHAGRSVTRVLVHASQDGLDVLILVASFDTGTSPFDAADRHQLPRLSPAQPERLPGLLQWFQKRADRYHWDAAFLGDHPFDIRIDPPAQGVDPEPHLRVWFRSPRPSAAEPVWGPAAAIMYVSDLLAGLTALVRYERGSVGPVGVIASLDHNVWMHRSAATSAWMCLDSHSPTLAGGRYLTVGSAFDTAGRLVASTHQQGVLGFATNP